MRSEQQPWNRIRLYLEIIDYDGTGKTGLTVHAVVKRVNDGKWLQSGGGWGNSPSTLTLTQIDSTNLPGAYGYSIATGDLDRAQGAYGYLVQFTETTMSLRETCHISQLLIPNDVLDADISDFSSLQAGSLGDAMWRMLHLRQENVRVVYTGFSNSTPTSGTVYLYGSKAAKEADTDPWAGALASYDFTATVTNGRVVEYGSTRES